MFYSHSLYLFCNYLALFLALSSNGESRLLDDIFRNYNKEARPVLNDNANITLKLGIAIHQLIEVVGIN